MPTEVEFYPKHRIRNKSHNKMMKASPLHFEAEEESREEGKELMMNKTKENFACNINEDDSEQQEEVRHDRLGDRVIECVKQAPNFSLRPARLAQQLGISIDEASSELCGLLAAVGGGELGAYFKFEEIVDKTTYPSSLSSSSKAAASVAMVFTFPSNFEQRCKAYRVKEEMKDTTLNILFHLFTIARALISFGLILSIAVIAMAAIIALLIATIAIVTGQGGSSNRQGGHHRHLVGLGTRHLQQLLNAARQILFMYVMFGNDDNGGYHQHARSALTASYWLGSGINPCWNPWFWMQASQMSRRSRIGRGWSTHTNPTWGNLPRTSTRTSSQENVRGALFIILEFLFGPDDQWESDPALKERWKIRALVISELDGRATLQELLPYVDNPPRSINDTTEAVWIISHFNGRPYCIAEDGDIKNTFCFPELMVDSENNANSNTLQKQEIPQDEITATDNNFTWGSLFYSSNCESSLSRSDAESLLRNNNAARSPRCLVERSRVMTNLNAEQFAACTVSVILNYFGVLWFKTVVTNGSIFPKKYVPLLVVQLLKSLATCLSIYSKLCPILFLGRLAVMMTRNVFISRRNQRRQKLADDINKMSQDISLPSAYQGDLEVEFFQV